MADILVVDDEAALVTLLCETFSADGHDVSFARDGEEAWELIQRRAFQVVVSDLRMPRLERVSNSSGAPLDPNQLRPSVRVPVSSRVWRQGASPPAVL